MWRVMTALQCRRGGNCVSMLERSCVTVICKASVRRVGRDRPTSGPTECGE